MKFWYHYNKPESKKAGYPKLTLHFRRTCNIIDRIEINVPTYSRNRNSQPYLVIAGEANKIEIINGIAKIS